MPAEINCALLLAAGNGARMQGVVEDKILAPIHGSPAFRYSVKAFAECELINTICVVYRDEAQKERLASALDDSIPQEVVWARGGEERRHSVLKGLQALPAGTSHTLIHDCARPLVTTELIRVLIDTARADGAASLAHPVTNTIKRIPAAGELKRTTLEDLQRDRLWAMETPQAFRHPDILKAYQEVMDKDLKITDDCAAAAHIGMKATLVHNTSPNPKITTAADLDYIRWLLTPNT